MVRSVNFISRRKVVYPFFVLIFSLILLVILYLYLFSQSLEVSDSSISLSGESILLDMVVTNSSNHVVNGVQVLVVSKDDQRVAPLKPENNFLLPGESYQTIIKVPITDSNLYTVYVKSPFNRDIKLFFELEESTLRPVMAEVHLSSKMVVGTTYDVLVKLCNVSSNDLFEVSWIENFESDYFGKTLDPRTISLKINECKNLYSTLTPLTVGKARVSFLLKVGSLEQRLFQDVDITEE